MSITNSNQDSLNPKITGIGGIFFKASDTNKTKQWYIDNLGIVPNDWGGVTFSSRDIDNPEQVNRLEWSLFKNDSDYFAPSTSKYMINYTVQNIEGLIEQFKANGVTIVDELAIYEYGKFIHILDNDGNKIELWEPIN